VPSGGQVQRRPGRGEVRSPPASGLPADQVEALIDEPWSKRGALAPAANAASGTRTLTVPARARKWSPGAMGGRGDPLVARKAKPGPPGAVHRLLAPLWLQFFHPPSEQPPNRSRAYHPDDDPEALTFVREAPVLCVKFSKRRSWVGWSKRLGGCGFFCAP
jgi:hypothetical protein